MSVFLITTLLMQEHRDHGTISMRKFYARRGIRLLPSALLCIAAFLVLYAIFDRERFVWMLQDAVAAITYTYNLVLPGRARVRRSGVGRPPFHRPVLVARGGGAVLPGSSPSRFSSASVGGG